MENNFFIQGLAIYLIGSIPFGLIITKIFGHGDIRKIGSGNIGATNVLSAGNKYIALLVLILDVIKKCNSLSLALKMIVKRANVPQNMACVPSITRLQSFDKFIFREAQLKTQLK